MIDDVDRTLEALLTRDLTRDLRSPVDISFATPDNQFPPPGVNLPVIDLFLYDIRENLELRINEWTVQRTVHSNGSSTAIRFPPLVRVDCSYLITAWPAPNLPYQEHMLLGAVMSVLLRYPKLPADILQGSLQTVREQHPSLPATALHSGHLQSLGEFWQALGGKPKAALNYTVTIAVQIGVAVDVPLVVESNTEVRPRLSGDSES